MKTLRFLAILALLSIEMRASYSPPPLGFKNYLLGTDLLAFSQKYDVPRGLQLGSVLSDVPDPKGYDYSDLRSGGVLLVEQPGLLGLEQPLPETIANAPATVTCYFYGESTKDWDVVAARHIAPDQAESAARPGHAPALRAITHGNVRPWTEDEKQVAARFLLGQIEVSFDSGKFESVVTALTTKYGTPSGRDVSKHKSDKGGLVYTDSAYWIRGDDRIWAESSTDKPMATVTFRRTSLTEREKTNRDNHGKVGARDL